MLLCEIKNTKKSDKDVESTKIPRGKTAIKRDKYSIPMKHVVKLINDEPEKYKTVFDYGSGKGDDVNFLNADGISAKGYDPEHAPSTKLTKSDIATNFYVLNVIEDPAERIDVIKKVMSLAKKDAFFAVRMWTDAARDALATATKKGKTLNDGFITSKGTFQKYFDVAEIEKLLSTATGKTPVKVFKNGEAGVWRISK